MGVRVPSWANTLFYIKKIMTLLQKIQDDWKEAMKNKDEIKKLILNFILAQVKNKKIELQKDLEDTDIVALIKKEIKQIGETIGFLEKADKQEELAIEKQKKLLLEFYLPATLSLEQTTEIINWLITELWITDIAKQRWMIMKEIMAKYKWEIDGSMVNEVINSKLAG